MLMISGGGEASVEAGEGEDEGGRGKERGSNGGCDGERVEGED